MWSLLLLSVSLALALLSILVWRRARSVLQWKLALLAGEFSAPWLLVSGALLVSSFWIHEDPAWALGTARCLLAAALVGFARPWFGAAVLLRRLPFQLARAFPEADGALVTPPLWGVPRAGRLPSRMQTVQFAERDGLPLEMDLYLPPDGVDAAPVVVVVHGGGWDGGSRTEIAHFNAWLASRGFLVAAPDYRLAPRHPWPACAEDVHAALAFLHARAEEWMGDSERLVLVGRSAGGQIAQSVAYAGTVPGLRGLISLYAPADLEFAWVHSKEDDVLRPLNLLSQYLGGRYPEAREAFRAASPYLAVTPDSVPTLLIHGRIDALVWHRQSQRLHARLNELGAPSVFVDVPWGTHAMEYNLNGPGGRVVRTAVEGFLRAVTSR